MDDHNVWAELMDTFQSSPDWIKALWIVSAPVLPLGALALVLRFRLATRRLQAQESGALV